MTKRSLLTHSLTLALTACLLWSTAFAGIKIGLQHTSPLQFAGLRFMLAGLLLFPLTKNRAANWRLLIKNFRAVALISLFQTIVLYTFFYLGIARTPAAIAAIIVGAGPLFVALLAHFITGKDPLTLRKMIALGIGFSGIILLALTKDRTGADQRTIVLGIVLLVTGNFAGSFGNILVSRNRTGITPIFLNAVQIFMGGLIIFIISLFFEDFHFEIKPVAYYLSLTWLSILSAAAFTLWFIVLSRPEIKVSEINVWKFIIPVAGAILSWLLVKGEKPEWYTIAGMTLIASSIVIIYFRGIYAFIRRRTLPSEAIAKEGDRRNQK